MQYPVLSDTKGEAQKAYGVGKGLFGLSDVARVTFIIDGKGQVRYVQVSKFVGSFSFESFVFHHRDALEGTLNYGAHSKFVTKWLEKLEAEGAQTNPPSGTEAVEATPAPAPAPVPSTEAGTEPAA